MPERNRRRLGARARWAVPAGVVAGIGIIIAATAVATADAAPALPPRTAQQLLTELAQSAGKPTGPFTATVRKTVNLGLPQLPDIAQQQGASPALTGGTQSVSIWYGGPQRIRVAEPSQGGETDLRVDGRTIWLWDSKTQTATRYVLPAQSARAKIKAGTGALRRLRANAKSGPLGQPVPATPQAAARQILSAVGPTTVVGVQRNVYVAGQAAYQLSLVPRSSESLVGQVLVAIDASRHIPLRVEVFPRGSSSVAYSIGYSALSFGAPASSNFSFTPPPGATVRTETIPGNLKSGLGGFGGLSGLSGLTSFGGLSGVSGFSGLGPAGLGPSGLGLGPLPSTQIGFSGPTSVTIHNALSPGQMGTAVQSGTAGQLRFALRPGQAPSKAAIARIKAQFAKSLPKNMTAAERAKAIAGFEKHFLRLVASAKLKGAASSAMRVARFRQRFVALPGQPKVKTIGTGWLTVIATPPSARVAQTLRMALAAPTFVVPSGGATSASAGTASTGSASTSSASTSSSGYSVIVSSSDPSTVVSSSQSAVAVPGPTSAVLRALLKATTPVHGAWGSGRLLQTRLFSVLITSKGQILAGAVTPALLYADVARDAS